MTQAAREIMIVLEQRLCSVDRVADAARMLSSRLSNNKLVPFAFLQRIFGRAEKII